MWALWLSTVAILSGAQLSPLGWRMRAHNLETLFPAPRIHDAPQSVVWPLCAGAIVWEATAAMLLWRAGLMSPVQEALVPAATLAFAVVLIMWVAFILMKGAFLTFVVEGQDGHSIAAACSARFWSRCWRFTCHDRGRGDQTGHRAGVGGGFGGVGSIRNGVLWDGFLKSITVLEMTEEAKTHTLEGHDVFGFIHACGTSGIMVELEVSLAPAVPWEEAVICFPDYADALRFSHQLALDESEAKRLISLNEWPIPSFLGRWWTRAGSSKDRRRCCSSWPRAVPPL